MGSNLFGTHGAHGAQKRIRIIHFFTWEQCTTYLTRCNFKVYGISPRKLLGNVGKESDTGILSNSAFVSQAAYSVDFGSQSSAFIVGEKDGLTEEMLSICHTILHVELPDTSFEASVPYESKIGICMYHFASTSLPAVSAFENEKFEIDRTRVFDKYTRGEELISEIKRSAVGEKVLEEPTDVFAFLHGTEDDDDM